MNHTTDNRLVRLQDWLGTLPDHLVLNLASLRPASGDASFRRYFRIAGRDGSLVVMDAPPPQEDCRPFVQVAQLLDQAGLRVPRVMAQDLEQGFLLLTDLGEFTYYQTLQHPIDAPGLSRLLSEASEALVGLQQADASALPVYDRDRLLLELQLFPEWYVGRHCGHTLPDADAAALQTVFSRLVDDIARQPRVFVHRDFHSPNLMVGTPSDPRAGVIDFQDALLGPLTYDLASMVMDARYTWEEPEQLDWAIRYWESARSAGLPMPHDFADLHRAYEWMSLQRNLRILGVFARLAHRDAKPHYLDHIPRVKTYVRQVATRYHDFLPLLRILDKLEGDALRTGFSF